MKKVLLLSVSPTEALNVLNGKQLALLRKRVPKGYVGWCYGVVSKGFPLLDYIDNKYILMDRKNHTVFHNIGMYEFYSDDIHLNGRIPFRFWYEDYSKLQYEEYIGDYIYGNMQLYEMKTFISNLCVDYGQIEKYGNGKDLYAISITKLEIFDKPMVLCELYYFKGYTQTELEEYNHALLPKTTLTKSPSTYQYVWVKE